ncbi:MAG: hypothetical protein KME60_16930 [Cyanomargarita calcarea GSE-NOS-MK-12-04C]|uniref:Outer membrane protein beta-barrel domain-containing protein n=1 Tax=Cyanomargarita calcarea GSE-NOS-MK-12-04C TaxID=2839659 RepID=A0A951UTZ8_9CYAN|nr:hypothetical protein [Cyanomargarita calcarea GSE-NOS-MK-12-04C]
MNTIFSRKGVFWVLSLAILPVLDSSLSAFAQTTDNTSLQLSQPSATETSPNQISPNHASELSNLSPTGQFPNAAVQETASRTVTPVPGTAVTSSEAFTLTSKEVAQADINPGRPTRGGRSYIGVAANIGVSGGGTSLGDGNFMVFSKVGLTNTISVRPSAVLGDNTVILVPVTYDFSFQPAADPFSEPLAIAPYIGAGAAIKTGDGSEVALLLSGGVDVPITPQFTATAAVNAGFFDQTNVGLMLGVGYNFGRQ